MKPHYGWQQVLRLATKQCGYLTDFTKTDVFKNRKKRMNTTRTNTEKEKNNISLIISFFKLTSPEI